jgi:hypothetical protein
MKIKVSDLKKIISETIQENDMSSTVILPKFLLKGPLNRGEYDKLKTLVEDFIQEEYDEAFFTAMRDEDYETYDDPIGNEASEEAETIAIEHAKNVLKDLFSAIAENFGYVDFTRPLPPTRR